MRPSPSEAHLGHALAALAAALLGYTSAGRCPSFYAALRSASFLLVPPLVRRRFVLFVCSYFPFSSFAPLRRNLRSWYTGLLSHFHCFDHSAQMATVSTKRGTSGRERRSCPKGWESLQEARTTQRWMNQRFFWPSTSLHSNFAMMVP